MKILLGTLKETGLSDYEMFRLLESLPAAFHDDLLNKYVRALHEKRFQEGGRVSPPFILAILQAN